MDIHHPQLLSSLPKRDRRTLYKDAAGLTQFDYGNNNSQIVNGVRPALSNENGLGAVMNNEILKTRTYASMNGYIKIKLLPELNFKSNIFYERATSTISDIPTTNLVLLPRFKEEYLKTVIILLH